MKQKQIEEMVKDVKSYYHGSEYDELENDISFSEYIVNLGWIKPAENAVVLTDSREIQQFEWSKLVDKMGIFELVDKECSKTHKETAEKLFNAIFNEFDAFDDKEQISVYQVKDILKYVAKRTY